MKRGGNWASSCPLSSSSCEAATFPGFIQGFMNFMHCHMVPASGKINKTMRPLQTAHQAGSWPLMNVVHLLGIEDEINSDSFPVHAGKCVTGFGSHTTTLRYNVFLWKQNPFVFFLSRFTVSRSFFVFFQCNNHASCCACVPSFLVGVF